MSIASPLIRNFGTLGGNINQRPRCWFFRGEDFNCYKKGGDFCYSVTGDNRYHAIIGGELCYIVHPSDTATALLALNASGQGRRPGRRARRSPFDNYFHGPREDVLTENVLKANEVMTEVFIPTPAAGTKMAWTKLKDRQVYDFARRLGGRGVHRRRRQLEGRPRHAGWRGARPVPRDGRRERAEGQGRQGDGQGGRGADSHRVARPMSLNAYKVDIAQGLIERTLLQALG